MQTSNIHVVGDILALITKSKEQKKIGIDIHGVITRYPEFFSVMIKGLMNEGHEVHVVTGARLSSVLIQNLLNCIPYTN